MTRWTANEALRSNNYTPKCDVWSLGCLLWEVATLGKIAKHYYGDAMKYTQIFEANSDILKNPDMIHPDQELIIPNL